MRRLLAILASALLVWTSPLHARGSVIVTEGTNFAIDVRPVADADDERPFIMDLQGMLWLLPEDGGKARRLTGPKDDIRLPRFSPDGNQLAFQSFRDGAWQLAITDADAANRKNLTAGISDNREPTWSPDGTRIYFSSDRSGNYEIWAVNLVTRKYEQITAHPADDYAPAISSLGMIALVSERTGKPAIFVAMGSDANLSYGTGSDLKQLYRAPAGKLSGLRFSPDGRKLAFVQARERISFPAISLNQLVVLDIGTGDIQVLSAMEDVFPLPPAWLDNETIFYTADGGIRQRSLNGDGIDSLRFKARLNISEAESEPSLPIAFSDKQQAALGIVNPVAMPNGQQVIFEMLGDLWTRDADGALMRITNDKFAERDPAVTTDGRWLTYISDRSGSMQVWMRDIGAGTDTQLTTNAAGPRFPTFSKNGDLLAWQDVGPIGTKDFRLNVLNLLTGANQRLRHAPAIWPGPMSWSADGEFLTVAELASTSTRFRDGRNRLVRVAINSGDTYENPLPGSQVADSGPVSSADGLQTALIIDGALYVVATAPDGSFTAGPQRVLDGLAESPSWSNNGTRLTYLSATGLAQLDQGAADSQELAIDLSWKNAVPRGTTIVHAGRMYNGVSRNYRTNVDIEIENGRIVAVKRHRPHRDKVRIIDASEQTVLPGLIDHHGHFQPHQGEWVGRAWLAYGVTTVVEPGGIPWQSRSLLETWGSGRRIGPRLVYAGPQLDGLRRSFHFASHINSDTRLRWEFKRAKTLDYGLIKTYVRLPGERQSLAIELATDQGIPVTAHSAFRNLAFGGNRIEHLRGGSRLGYSAKQSDAQKTYGDIIAMVSENETAVTPTVVVAGGFFNYLLGHPELLDNRQLIALYPENYRKGLLGFARMMGKNEALLQFGHRQALKSIADLHDAGATIIAGTDSPIFPYGMALIVELINYQEAGLAPWEVLETATSKAAEALGAEDVAGSIRPDRVADLVVVAGDPLDDVSELLNVRGVMRNGNYYTLDELLE